jgi:hypothetical protein
VELSNGDILGFGSFNNLVVLLGADGTKKWEKEYTNPDFDNFTKGFAELEGVVYLASQGRVCDGEGCEIQAPLIESISLENGTVNSSVEISSLNGALWGHVGSFSTTSAGDFLLSYSVEKADCTVLFECVGAGMAIVNSLGQIESEWNSLGTSLFSNGRYAAESPLGGLVLLGQNGVTAVPGFGAPLALFDADGVYSETHTSRDAYSNQKEYIAFSDSGAMYQLVQKYSVDWPVLISRAINGSSEELIVFSKLKRARSYPVGLTSAIGGGLVLVFNEDQGGLENSDIVIVKTAALD